MAMLQMLETLMLQLLIWRKFLDMCVLGSDCQGFEMGEDREVRNDGHRKQMEME